MVVHETLRLYAAVPSGLPGIAHREGAELAGYWRPGGFSVCSLAYSMHQDPVIFPQLERFGPNRWAKPTKAMRDAFMPFGGGARGICSTHGE